MFADLATILGITLSYDDDSINLWCSRYVMSFNHLIYTLYKQKDDIYVNCF